MEKTIGMFSMFFIASAILFAVLGYEYHAYRDKITAQSFLYIGNKTEEEKSRREFFDIGSETTKVEKAK